MIGIAERAPASRGWTALGAVGLALVWLARTTPAELSVGGLAPLAVTALVAGVLGAPLARLEWRTPSASTRWRAVLSDAVDLWTVLLVAAAAATVTHGHHWAVAAAGLGWVLLPLSQRTRGLPVPALAGLAVLVALAGLRPVAPWTLLSPGWSSAAEWLPTALTGGFVLSAAGLGQYADAPRPPGTSRQPWAVAGGALLAVAVLALGLGSAWEGAAVLSTPWALAASSLAVLAGVSALGARRRNGSAWMRALVGAAATAWWAGPAWEALPAWWGTLLPLGIAAVAASLALTTRGSDRLLPALAGAVALVAAMLGWPGFPDMRPSAALAALVVAVVWVVGTRALVRVSP